jgi:hypothetical protein
MTTLKQAFGKTIVSVPVQSIVSQRELSSRFLKGTAYKRIASSISHIGLVEPIAVYPRAPNEYLLLDGHVRLHVLKENGAVEVPAILENDDEAYTYNKRVNHPMAVAEHFMILKALSNGVTQDVLAAVLNVDVASIQKKVRMLEGICPEAFKVLRDAPTTPSTFAVLKKMKPVRQIAVADHMRASGNYSARFVTALLEVTRPELRLDMPRTEKAKPVSVIAQAMLEQESELLVRDLKTMEESYGTDVLALSISSAYIGRLLSNPAIEHFLEKYHPDILGELRTFVVAKPSPGIAHNS